jgi:hypothetical protein
MSKAILKLSLYFMIFLKEYIRMPFYLDKKEISISCSYHIGKPRINLTSHFDNYIDVLD